MIEAMKSRCWNSEERPKATAEAPRAPRSEEKGDGEIAVEYLSQSRLIFGFLGVCLGVFGVSAVAFADGPVTPFYYASGTAVEPQIATLVIGVNDSVGQAVVSGDRKYVTMNMDASLMGDAGIRKFTYQRGGLGFVGSTAMPAQPSGRNSLTPSIAASAGEISPAISMLDKPGMVLIAPLER
jgi:hypothetical protein